MNMMLRAVEYTWAHMLAMELLLHQQLAEDFLPPLEVLEIFCPPQVVLRLLERLTPLMTGPYPMLQIVKVVQVIMDGTSLAILTVPP